MRNKFLTLLMLAGLGIIFAGVGALVASEAKTEPPEEVVIENEGYKRDRKGPVKLSHAKHTEEYEAECTSCHHEYEDGKNVWEEGEPVKGCVECHDPEEKKDDVLKLQNAYHKNCKDCHRDYVKEHKDSEAPYRRCNDCHGEKD